MEEQIFTLKDELPIVAEKRNFARKAGDFDLFRGFASIVDDINAAIEQGYIYATVDGNGKIEPFGYISTPTEVE